jgi:hypothetical protein
MEAPAEFPSVTLSDLATSSSAAPAAALFSVDSSGKARLRFVQTGSVSPLVDLDLDMTQVVIIYTLCTFFLFRFFMHQV